MTKTKTETVVITGVTRGLGRAMTVEFIRLGLTVIGCGRNEEAVGQLRRLFGNPHDFEQVDVASDDQVHAWADRILKTYGPPAFLLNNAGLINRSAPLWEMTATEFSDVIDVNLKGVANVIRHFVPAMIARSSGIVVNFSSGWGRATDAKVAPYCATKWGIEGLSQAMAQELPGGMACVALDPGMINTDMLQSSFGKQSSMTFPAPTEWAKRAVPFILKLNASQNGKSLSVPSGHGG